MIRELKRLWVRSISLTIWLFEYVLFYPKLKRVLSSLPGLTHESVIFDVGANRGQSIKFFWKIFPNIKIYSFEPSPNIFRKLRKLSSANLQTYNIGLSSADGTAVFHESILDEASTFDLPDINSDWHKTKSKLLRVDKSEMYSEIEVPIRRIDNLVDENGIRDIFLLKIDVEGHEIKVLQGAQVTFEKRIIKNIQIERHLNDLRVHNDAKIEELLLKHEFRRVASIRHSIGNFFEDVFTLENQENRV